MVSVDDLPGLLEEAQLEKDAGVLFQEEVEGEGPPEVFVGGDDPAEEEDEWLQDPESSSAESESACNHVPPPGRAHPSCQS